MAVAALEATYDTMVDSPMRLAPFILFVCTVSLRAQTPLGAVTGLATDPSGAAVPSAALTLTNETTGVKRAAATNATGAYSFPDVAPGQYHLGAESKGFRPIETRAFAVEAYRTVRQDLIFEVAGATTEVVVTDVSPAAIQTESPAVTSAVTGREIIELPTNLRSVAKNSGDSGLISSIMPLTIPGVVQVGNGAKWLTPGAGASSMKVKVDGIETTFANFGSPDNVSQPSVEAIQEFSANILTSRAEFGGMGTITTATKSGTNRFHGNLFWYVRNSALDSRNAYTIAKPYQNLHTYGGTIGGPIQKDKTFFFADFDGMRGTAAYGFAPNVPTVGMRGGDFSGFGAIRNPFTNVPFAGNIIPSNLLSPQALAVQKLLFPLPNFGAANLTAANYRASFNGPEVHRTEEIKLDHNFSERETAFLRYENRKDDYHIPGARSALPPQNVGTSDNIRRVNFWTAGLISTLRPNLINELRAGVVILVSASSGDLNGQALMDQFGISGLPTRGNTSSLPYFNISGITANSINLLNPVNDGHAQFADNLSWIHGRHTVKVGAEEVSWFDNRFQPNSSGNPILGTYAFSTRFTGNAYADFLMGLPNQVTRMEPYRPQYIRGRDWSFYAQDDFKIGRKLTLMYGLRYEYNGPTYTNDDNIYSFDLATGKIVLPSDMGRRFLTPLLPSTIPYESAADFGTGRSLRNPDKNNLAPRFGFSYGIGNHGRTVVRGGWGIYYSHYSGDIPVTESAGPFSATTVSTNAITNGVASFTLASPFAIPGTPGTLALGGVSPHLLNSYTQQYSLSLEHALTRNTGVRVSYIGSKGTQLAYRRDANQPLASTVLFNNARRPYPAFANITYSDNGANMLYSGLQAQLNRRFNHGLMFTSSYTWAKELSDTDDTGDFELNTTIEDTYDRRRDRGNVYSVPRHQWMNHAIYELPGRGRLLGDWQVNLLFNMQSGNWFTPVLSGPDPTNTLQTTLRPDVSGPVQYPSTQSPWFDPSVFTTPASGHWGNAGRGIIEGPGFILLNTGLQKKIRMERFGSIVVVASFTNVPNHLNLGEPTAGGTPLPGVTIVNNANAGRITGSHIFPPAGSPRTGQLGVRWNF
jgi:hypothetical protein